MTDDVLCEHCPSLTPRDAEWLVALRVVTLGQLAQENLIELWLDLQARHHREIKQSLFNRLWRAVHGGPVPLETLKAFRLSARVGMPMGGLRPMAPLEVEAWKERSFVADPSHPRREFPRHPGPPFSWDEIERVMNGREVPQSTRHLNLKPPLEPPRPCPRCGESCEWLYWTSPRMTWKMLCGCEGWVEICRACQEWHPLERTTLMI